MTQQEFRKRYEFNLKTDNIGGGSFGTVYKAYDNALDREVAIKVSEVKIVGDKEFSLLEEYKAIENLTVHKNIANYEEVYRFESFPTFFDYGIMQYYPLGNLSHYLKHNEVSLEKRESITKDILDGIAFLHQHKVVHRDLKPSNVLVVDRRGKIIPKITDFGLSKQAEGDGKASRFTNSFAGGTLQYSSPEQLKGLPLKLNTDLWSFGVIAYEILTGKTLFETESQSTASAEWQNTITQKILHADITKELQTLPSNWQKVVSNCLERDVSKRAQDTTVLFSFLNGEEGFKEKMAIPNTDETVIKTNNSKTASVKKPIKKSTATDNNATFIKGNQKQEKPPYKKTTFKKPQVEKQASAIFKNKNILMYSIPAVVLIVITLFFLFPWESDVKPSDLEMYNGYKATAANFYQLDSLEASLIKYKEAAVFMANLNINKATDLLMLDGVKDSIASVTKRLEAIDIAKENNAWNLAKTTNSVEAYNQLLKKYPESTFKDEVIKKIDILKKAESDKLAKEQQIAKEEANRIPAVIKALEQSMVYVRGGSFTMGCDSEKINCEKDESPEHLVTLSGFRIGKYEVTQSQWKALMNSVPDDFPKCDDCLVGAVSWNEVQVFIKRLNKLTGKRYRLPTEAEWEYAARGGSKSQGYHYSGSNTLKLVAWFVNNSDDKPHEVGKKQPNELGLYDMSGNLHEWCSDWYDENYYSNSPTKNPKGPSSGTKRVHRGGSLYDYGNFCRVYHRSGIEPEEGYVHVGFRLALN